MGQLPIQLAVAALVEWGTNNHELVPRIKTNEQNALKTWICNPLIFSYLLIQSFEKLCIGILRQGPVSVQLKVYKVREKTKVSLYFPWCIRCRITRICATFHMSNETVPYILRGKDKIFPLSLVLDKPQLYKHRWKKWTIKTNYIFLAEFKDHSVQASFDSSS